MQELEGLQPHELQLGENYVAFLAWQTQQDFVVNLVPIPVGMRHLGGAFWEYRAYFFAILWLLDQLNLSDFREEPSPNGAADSWL